MSRLHRIVAAVGITLGLATTVVIAQSIIRGRIFELTDNSGATQCQFKTGTGDPEGSVSAPACSEYRRTNGKVYRKDSGSGNTGWVDTAIPSSGSGSGDTSTDTSTSSDGQGVVFSGAGGKTLKRFTLTGFVKAASGVLSTVASAGSSVNTGAAGSEPGSPASSDLYFPNNGFYVERYSGSAWVPWGPLFAMTPPVDGDFSWINQGGASTTTTNGGIYLLGPASTINVRARVKTAPTTPYSITVAFLANKIGQNTQHTGILFRESSSGKLHTLSVYTSGGTVSGLASAKWSNNTTVSAEYLDKVFPITGVIWLRIADTGATAGSQRICSYSSDGINFVQFTTIGRTDFITADQVGFFIDEETNTFPVGLTLLSWKEGS